MMEVERPPLEFKEEQQLLLMESESEEEDTSALLHTRDRDRDRDGKKKKTTAPSDSDSDTDYNAAAAATEAHAPHHQSIFLDPAQGAENQVAEVDGQKENTDETSDAQDKEIEKQENVITQETNHSSSNGKLENGSHSHSNGAHEISSSSETVTVPDALKLITTIRDARHMLPNWGGSLDVSNNNGTTSASEVHEIEVEKDEIVTKGEAKVEEYDLEKILDEQETHDLYCPNCKSCITRRVILKKRKRTVRSEPRKEPPKRPQLVEPSPNVPRPTVDDEESPEVFRCLSCFTFFIPTGCSFNIFRIFERRDVNQQVQVQHSAAPQQTSENCGSWILSCFRTVESPKPSNNAGSLEEPLLSDSQRTDDIASVENNTLHHQTTTATNEVEQSFSQSHASTIVTDILEDKTAPSDNSPFFSQPFSDLVRKVPTKVLPGEDNQTVKKPASVIGQPVESEAPPHTVVAVPEAEIPVAASSAPRDEWDILKAIVYGGLVESITSLSVVSAAAASGAKTLDIFILGIANLIGGLPLVYHSIADLRNTGDAAESSEQVGHYWLHLGRRSKYQLHMVIAILSYILFGLLPPVMYGLSFRTSDNRENKILVVAAVSLFCIALLAIGKAHVKRPRTYFTTLLYYLSIGFSSSGLSYVAGVLITKLLAHFGIIDQGGASAPAPPGLSFPEAAAWASY